MVTIQKLATMTNKQLNIANALISLAKDLALLAEEQLAVAEEIGNTIMVQLQVYAVIIELQTYLKSVGDSKFSY